MLESAAAQSIPCPRGAIACAPPEESILRHLIRVAVFALVVLSAVQPIAAQSAADERSIRDVADRLKVAPTRRPRPVQATRT